MALIPMAGTLDHDQGKSRVWSIRYKSPVTGKRREMGIGPARDVSLAEARDIAGEARKLLRRSIDPIEHRKQVKEVNTPREIRSFKSVAELYIKDRQAGAIRARPPFGPARLSASPTLCSESGLPEPKARGAFLAGKSTGRDLRTMRVTPPLPPQNFFQISPQKIWAAAR